MALPMVRRGHKVVGPYIIRAEYSGGPYVELSFDLNAVHRQGYSAPWPTPIEVINVRNYAVNAGQPGAYDERVDQPRGIKAILEEWVKDVTDPDQGGDPDAIKRYYENARY